VRFPEWTKPRNGVRQPWRSIGLIVSRRRCTSAARSTEGIRLKAMPFT
jgi:hypothetical protein